MVKIYSVGYKLICPDKKHLTEVCAIQVDQILTKSEKLRIMKTVKVRFIYAYLANTKPDLANTKYLF